MNDLHKQSAKGVLWSLLQATASRALSFVVFAVLANLVDARAFGLIALVAVFVAVMELLAEQGFGTAITQREQIDPVMLDTAFWTNLGLGVALAAVLAGVSPAIAWFFSEPELAPLVSVTSLVLVLRSLASVQESLLRREFQFRALSIRAVLSALAGGIAGVVAALAGAGVWSLVTQQLVAATVATGALWTVSSWRPALRFSKPELRELFRFSSSVLGASLLSFANRRSDDFLIGCFLGPVALGVYAVAYRVLLVLTQLLTSTANAVALSAFSRLQGDIPRLREAFYAATRLSAIVATPVFAGVAIIAPSLVPLVFGDKWHPSVRVLQILILIGPMHAVNYFNASVFWAIGRPELRLRLLLVHTAVNVGAFLVVVRYGIVAVAAAYVIRAYALAPIDLVVLRRVIGLRIGAYLRSVAPALVATAIMSAAVGATRSAVVGSASLAVDVSASVLVGAITYTAALWATAPRVVREIVGHVRVAVGRKRSAVAS